MSTLRMKLLPTAGLALLAALVLGPAAAAPVSLEFLAAFDPADDVHVLLHATREFFDASDAQVEQAAEAAQRPEELGVVLFLAHAAGVEPSRVAARRVEGVSWSAILSELGVSRDRLYLDLPADVGAPYGKAYARPGSAWHARRARMSDEDVTELVALQVTAGYFEQRPIAVVHLRRAGKSFAAIQGELYRTREEARLRASRPRGEEDLSLIDEPTANAAPKGPGK